LTEKKGWMLKLTTIDPRVIFLLLFICVGAPLLSPLGLPVGISPGTSSMYTFIEGLPSGSVVVSAFDMSAAVAPECYPQVAAFTTHLKNKNLKIVEVAFDSAGPMFADQALKDVFGASKDHPLYGKNFVNLGYVAGGEAAMRSFATNPKMIQKDFYGKEIKDLEIMQPLSSAKDFKLMIVITGGQVDNFVRQFGDPYGVPIAGAVTAVLVTRVMPFYPAKVIGYLNGLRGAAEYELLVKRPGIALAGMDAQSAAHLLVIIFVIVGNVGYMVRKSRRPQLK